MVWMPKEVKERVKNFIPPELVDKIATEENAKTVDELKVFPERAQPPSCGKLEGRSCRSRRNRARTIRRGSPVNPSRHGSNTAHNGGRFQDNT